MTTISAKTILRSRNTAAPDKVLSTLLLRYPRWIHAEQRTHRVIALEEGLSFLEPTPSLMADVNLSRNAASSRAIPVQKLIDDLRADPAIPLWWGANQKGMQALEECAAPVWLPKTNMMGAVYAKEMSREDAWLWAMEQAIIAAEALAKAGYHKQLVNRLLEPFTHITVLVSATEWGNFLELRDHKDAEPHIEMLAKAVRECLDRTDDIQDLQPGEWHLPFVASDEWESVPHEGMTIDPEAIDRQLIKLSTARCASTSYKTVDGFDMTLERAIKLHDQLVVAEPLHASPAEHVAQADAVTYSFAERSAARLQRNEGNLTPLPHDWAHGPQHGNFVGFRQYRHQL